jgi:hypothetical protein
MRATRDTSTRDRLQTHPYMSAKATAKQATSDHCGRWTREAAQRGPARHRSKVMQAGLAQRRVAVAQGDTELPGASIPIDKETE